jgi:hypothetical protein
VAIDPSIVKIIKRCQKSPSFFLDSFGKVKHPKLGIIPFRLFDYQKKCLKAFLTHRFNIFRKCRQCGISTLTGAYALWYAMFFNNKTILIVSKRDIDAMEFVTRNIKFVYDNLPDWMQKLWPIVTRNEHSLVFANGSVIRSLTSSADTLRSNASSLNIIDEAAFMPNMEDMWAGGWSTLQHGGNVIVISTAKGVGNWYWKTWTDAESRTNNFNPIVINWWDMDWRLEYTDELSGRTSCIAPTDGMRPCQGPIELEKYGPWWSPWLENEYKGLATKGDDSKFRQEVLAEFIGSGSNVLSRAALSVVSASVSLHPEYKIIDRVDYVNPVSQDRDVLDFQGGLWVWNPPVVGDPEAENPEDRIPHQYVIGADPSSGEAHDYCALQVMDCYTKEQVAELRIKTLPKTFARMIDYIGRLYNQALVVCERNGIGQAVCQELNEDIVYPNLWRQRKKRTDLKLKWGHIGWPTTHQTKHILVKYLVDNIGVKNEADETDIGFIIKSPRLYKEFLIFVHLDGGKYGNEPGTGNTDDLVMATCMAFAGMIDANLLQSRTLVPLHNIGNSPIMESPAQITAKINDFLLRGGKNLLTPVTRTSEKPTGRDNKMSELRRFMDQLGGTTISQSGSHPPLTPYSEQIVHIRKHNLRPGRR